ncbi:MAG: hypothetical protein JO016_12655 [Actinobacteria bacterium]|nr:hypothetical protein [Actinomycetota bacterium]
MLVRQRTTDHVHTAGASTRLALAGAAAVAAAVAVAVAACGSTQAPSASGSSPSRSATPSRGATLQASSGVCSSVPKLTALTVRRMNDLPQNHLKFVFPATEAVTSATQVQTVAKSLCALPQQGGSVTCPMDNGVSYQLTFVEGSTKFTPVTAEASGCSIVKGLGQPRRVEPSTALWQALGLAIGIPHPDQRSFTGAQTAQGANS